MTPQPGGLEPTDAADLLLIVCPHCGRELPPVAPRASKHAAQVAPAAGMHRAPELEDATPTVAHPINPRLAPTDQITRIIDPSRG